MTESHDERVTTFILTPNRCVLVYLTGDLVYTMRETVWFNVPFRTGSRFR